MSETALYTPTEADRKFEETFQRLCWWSGAGQNVFPEDPALEVFREAARIATFAAVDYVNGHVSHWRDVMPMVEDLEQLGIAEPSAKQKNWQAINLAAELLTMVVERVRTNQPASNYLRDMALPEKLNYPMRRKRASSPLVELAKIL